MFTASLVITASPTDDDAPATTVTVSPVWTVSTSESPDEAAAPMATDRHAASPRTPRPTNRSRPRPSHDRRNLPASSAFFPSFLTEAKNGCYEELLARH